MNDFSPPAEKKKGLSTVVIVLIVLGSMLVLAVLVIALLIVLLLPAIGRAREAAMQVRHQSNARIVALALEQYEANNGAQPPLASWDSDLVAQGYISQDTLSQGISNAPTPAFFFVPDFVVDSQTGAEHEFVVYAHPGTFEDGGVLVRDDGSATFLDNPAFTDLVGRMQNPDGTAFAPHDN